jgi:hypothetical protein
MASKKCRACGDFFEGCPQIREQSFCSKTKCQRERKRQWQKSKRKQDPEYRDNQARAQKTWSQRNPEYWSKYRGTHPTYCERNRKRQRKRNAKRKTGLIAKMDVSTLQTPLLSGLYRLSPIAENGIAKMDAWTVEIRFLFKSSTPPASTDDDCKERT